MSTIISEQLISQLKVDEGFRANFYVCTAGHNTIGYGRNVDANPYFKGKKITAPVSRELAEQILLFDIQNAIEKLNDVWNYFSQMGDSPRKDVCINMTFNIGINGFMKFAKVRDAISKGNWNLAADEMKNSAWYSQVGGRAVDLCKQMRTGKYK